MAERVNFLKNLREKTKDVDDRRRDPQGDFQRCLETRKENFSAQSCLEPRKETLTTQKCLERRKIKLTTKLGIPHQDKSDDSPLLQPKKQVKRTLFLDEFSNNYKSTSEVLVLHESMPIPTGTFTDLEPILEAKTGKKCDDTPKSSYNICHSGLIKILKFGDQNDVAEQNNAADQDSVADQNNVTGQDCVVEQNNVTDQDCVVEQNDMSAEPPERLLPSPSIIFKFGDKHDAADQKSVTEQKDVADQDYVVEQNDISAEPPERLLLSPSIFLDSGDLFLNDELDIPSTSMINHLMDNDEADIEDFIENASDSAADPDFILEDENESDDSDRTHIDTIKQKSRKRLKFEDNWKKNLQKRKINTGQEYVSRSGVLKRAKVVKPPCNGCLFECNDKITLAQRKSIHNNFYCLGDKTRQRDFILRNVTPVVSKVKPRRNMPKKRGSNMKYEFTINGKSIRVCKTFFTATLDISNNTINTALAKSKDGFLEKESRGTGPSQNKLSEDLVNDVKNHINSFPRIESHYCRARSTKEYIEGSLNILTMYKLYKDQCEAEQKEYVKEAMYRKIFNTKFNVSFFKPKKDQCNFCMTYEKFSTDNERESNKEQYNTHKTNVKLSRAEKDSDKTALLESTDGNKVLATFDLQAVIQLPNGNMNAFFYKSKLNVYNFTIFDIKSKEGYCYLWNESIARRGAIELSTCIFNYLKDYCQGKEEVIFYSDNCVAQNKNKFLFSMYLYAVEHFNIQKITHKYLIIGHTENEGDSIHACIEKEKKRILNQTPLFVPSDIAMIIRCAKKNEPKYKVNELECSDFIDWKRVCDEIGKNFNINKDKEKCLWHNVKMVQIRKTEPFNLYYKTDYSQTEYSNAIDVRRGTTRQRKSAGTTDINQIVLNKAYNEAPKVPVNKVKDLLQLCQSKAIPERHHLFFRNLESHGGDFIEKDDGALVSEDDI